MPIFQSGDWNVDNEASCKGNCKLERIVWNWMHLPLWNIENLKALLQYMNSIEHIVYVNDKLTRQPWVQDKNCIKSGVAACRNRPVDLHKLSLSPSPCSTFLWFATLLERKTFIKGLLEGGWFLAESASQLLNWFLHLPPQES